MRWLTSSAMIGLLVLSTPCLGQLTRLHVCEVDNSAVLSGFVTSDILLDFEGQLFGQQMVVELTSGSIYHDDVFGGDGPPNESLFPFAPNLQFDTFVTLGGPTQQSSEDLLIVGGSTELGKNGPRQIDNSGINIAWAPAPGVVIEDRADFMVARLTLSDDANGFVYYFGNAAGQGAIYPAGTVENGRFGPLTPDPLDCLPEPASAALAAFATLAACRCRR